MSYERPGRVVDLVANAILVHGVPHYQSSMAGIPIKQDNPKTLDSLVARTQIASGVKYALRHRGVCEVDVASISGAVLGSPVYIVKTTDALTLTAGSTGLNLPFGRVVALAGTYGVPTGKVRINMDLKDTITVP